MHKREQGVVDGIQVVAGVPCCYYTIQLVTAPCVRVVPCILAAVCIPDIFIVYRCGGSLAVAVIVFGLASLPWSLHTYAVSKTDSTIFSQTDLLLFSLAIKLPRLNFYFNL